MKIYQLVAGFTENDAISAEARIIKKKIQEKGFFSEIVSPIKHTSPELKKDVLSPDELEKNIANQDIALLHLSCGSQINEIFAELPCKKALLYHNITPAFYFKGFRKELFNALKKGRDEAQALAHITSVAMADSNFNAAELKEWGFKEPAIVPLILDFSKYALPANPLWLDRLQDGKLNILFVGRCVPNKKIEDLLRFFAVFKRAVSENARLIVAGSTTGMERYYSLLLIMAKELEIKDDVIFTGSISQAGLNACYKSAHLFLSMSEHEGFCIPLMEAMHFGVPVVAYKAGAVPETMAGAGVVFLKKDFPQLAELAGRIIFNNDLRAALIKREEARVASYRAVDHFAKLFNKLAHLFS